MISLIKKIFGKEEKIEKKEETEFQKVIKNANRVIWDIRTGNYIPKLIVEHIGGMTVVREINAVTGEPYKEDYKPSYKETIKSENAHYKR